MHLKDYVSVLQIRLAATPFVTATSLSYEERPPTAGVIKGTLLFTDNSQLDFKEFIITEPTFRIIKYAYNYQKNEQLFFRYDNANDPAARDLPTFPCHKHISSSVILGAEKPSLDQVLKEIISQLKFP
jgi:hypothetical protein